MPFDCLNQVNFRLFVNSDEICVIRLTNIFVPEVQSENPIVANPASVLPLNSVNFPSTTIRDLFFVAKNTSDGQVFHISLQCCILFVDKRLNSAGVSILFKLLVFKASIVFYLVLSLSKRSR